jgi:hypothetical protein
MDFVNWVLSRFDEVMADADKDRGGSTENIEKRTLERVTPIDAAKSSDVPDVSSSLPAA